ncbi:MAG: DUF2244 domain-containing protein [Gammaproteobacteria bacterium]
MNVLCEDPIVTRIVVQRNQSLDFSGFTGFFALSFIPQFAFLLLAALAGWWPVVGFVGAVFLLLAGVLYGVMASALTREVITVTRRRLIVEYGRGRVEFRVELDRYWTRVERRKDEYGRLVLCSRGVALEVGSVLAAPERAALACRLAELVGPSTPAFETETRSAVAAV